jgi:hypothetical protein
MDDRQRDGAMPGPAQAGLGARPGSDRSAAVRVEGYAIVSTDGMLADATGIMPEGLKFAADQRFFEAGLSSLDVLVHGRHSHERRDSRAGRRRLILTRHIRTLAADALDADAYLWNPAGATLERALSRFGEAAYSVGVIGGGGAFDLFLDRYDAFYLSRVPGLLLAGGRPVFGQVPKLSPEQVLQAHGMVPGTRQVLDARKDVTMVKWTRGSR